MKFATSQFWKHRNVCCEFFEIVKIIEDDGVTAEIKVVWNEQLNNGYVALTSDQFRITKKQYSKWQGYQPRGAKL